MKRALTILALASAIALPFGLSAQAEEASHKHQKVPELDLQTTGSIPNCDGLFVDRTLCDVERKAPAAKYPSAPSFPQFGI